MPFPGRHLTALFGSALLAQSGLPVPPIDPLLRVTAIAVEAPVADGTPVVVVDEHGDAVKDALVAVIDVPADAIGPAGMRAITAAMAQHLGDELRQAAIAMTWMGTCFRTGADGSVRVRLPHDRPFVSVKALHGDRLGEALVATDSPAIRLVALRERLVTVTVTDADDRPLADVPVGLFAREQTTAVHEAFTDASGTATLREPRFLRRTGTPVEAGLALPLATAVRSRVAWRSYTPTITPLRAPALAEVLVRDATAYLSDPQREQLWRGRRSGADTRFLVGVGIGLLAIGVDSSGRERLATVRKTTRAGELVIVVLPEPRPER